jgi:hypothetical protein
MNLKCEVKVIVEKKACVILAFLALMEYLWFIFSSTIRVREKARAGGERWWNYLLKRSIGMKMSGWFVPWVGGNVWKMRIFSKFIFTFWWNLNTSPTWNGLKFWYNILNRLMHKIKEKRHKNLEIEWYKLKLSVLAPKWKITHIIQKTSSLLTAHEKIIQR